MPNNTFKLKHKNFMMFPWKIIYLQTTLCFWSMLQIRTAHTVCIFNSNHSQDIHVVYLLVIHMYIHTYMCMEKAQNALGALEWKDRTTVHWYSVKPRLASKLYTNKIILGVNISWKYDIRLHRILFNFKIKLQNKP